jgi:hypothetical protein
VSVVVNAQPSWPAGPRFRVSELRGYAFRPETSGGSRSGTAKLSSEYYIVDDAYRCVVRSFPERVNRSRESALGYALYVAAALNADPLSYVVTLEIVSLANRIRNGVAPNFQSKAQLTAARKRKRER